MIRVNALGDTCPIPVVKTKEAIKEMKVAGTVEILVDNEIAVQNLTKMAKQKGYGVTSKKLEEQKFEVYITVSENNMDKKEEPIQQIAVESAEAVVDCTPDRKKKTVVVISSQQMGNGNEELGIALIKGFIYALAKQDVLPTTMLFYNGGATLTTESSASLEDLQSLEAQGVEILTCGTCLNYYGLTEKLAVGSVTNMYVIVEIMMQADYIVKPC